MLWGIRWSVAGFQTGELMSSLIDGWWKGRKVRTVNTLSFRKPLTMLSLTPANLYMFHCLSGIAGQRHLFSGGRNMGRPSCCACPSVRIDLRMCLCVSHLSLHWFGECFKITFGIGPWKCIPSVHSNISKVYSNPDYPQVNYLQLLISLVNICWLCPASDRTWRVLKYNARLATGRTVRRSNPGGGEIFPTCQDRPWGPPSLLYNGYRVFHGG